MRNNQTQSKPIVLVTGATGNQGGETARALLARGHVHVRFLTRNPSSKAAQALVSAGAEAAVGEFDDAPSLDRALEGVSAAFSVQRADGPGGVEAEERQGIAFAEAAHHAGVHLVYSSVDGAERESAVPHFESKRAIELHIQSLGMSATILRPVAFMENFAIPSLGRAMFLGMFRALAGAESELQLVSTRDVGWFAACALEEPERSRGRVLPLATEVVTLDSLLTSWADVTGRRPRVAPVPRALAKLMLPTDISKMLVWFGSHGYEADIQATRRERPDYVDLRTWIAEHEGVSTRSKAA